MEQMQFYDSIVKQERKSKTDSKIAVNDSCNPDTNSSSNGNKEETNPGNSSKSNGDKTEKFIEKRAGSEESLGPTEISSILTKNPNRVVVRPIAFKPVAPSKRQESSSPESTSTFTATSYNDEGYSSYDTASRGCSNSGSTMSKTSDTVYASPVHITDQTLETPDTELDRLLQKKDTEIVKLRRTMELNESAIVRVHENKRIEWETQMTDLAQEYHRRLGLQQDSSRDRESELRQMIANLEIDNRQLAINIQQNRIDQDRQEHLAAQTNEFKQRNVDLNHKLIEQRCECDRLRQQNKELDSRARMLQEQLSLGSLEQSRLNNKLAELQDSSCKAERDHGMQLSQLRHKIEAQEQQLQQDKDKFKHEKKKWHEEREKVMQYQKQLQKTYVHMYRRNNELEQQLCRINSRRFNRLDTQSLQGSMDRHSVLDVDLESCAESFC